MEYNEAITIVEHEINKKRKEIENLEQCIEYLKNERLSNDSLTQPAEKILENFGFKYRF